MVKQDEISVLNDIKGCHSDALDAPSPISMIKSNFFVPLPSIEETTGPNWAKFCFHLWIPQVPSQLQNLPLFQGSSSKLSKCLDYPSQIQLIGIHAQFHENRFQWVFFLASKLARKLSAYLIIRVRLHTVVLQFFTGSVKVMEMK